MPLLFPAIALAALLGLAAAMHNAEFQPAEWERIAEAQALEAPAGFSWRLVLFFAILIGVGLMIWLLMAARSDQPVALPSSRTRWRSLIRGLITFFMFLWIYRNYDMLGLTYLNFGPPLADGAGAVTNTNPASFVAPTISPAVTYLFSFTMAAIFLVVAWLLGRRLLARRLPDEKPASLNEIAQAARTSLDDLSAGRDLDDAVMRCYLRMTEVVAHQRGLQRNRAMTAAEFSVRLQEAGLPTVAVHRLTNLFESVRYGARGTGDRERQEATECLGSILAACGEAV